MSSEFSCRTPFNTWACKALMTEQSMPVIRLANTRYREDHRTAISCPDARRVEGLLRDVESADANVGMGPGAGDRRSTARGCFRPGCRPLFHFEQWFHLWPISKKVANVPKQVRRHGSNAPSASSRSGTPSSVKARTCRSHAAIGRVEMSVCICCSSCARSTVRCADMVIN